jgi:hypothetical protein
MAVAYAVPTMLAILFPFRADEMFKSLESGDVLFIDSSHVIRRQGDVLHEILHLLPQISGGV